LVSIEQEAGWTTGFLGEETESLALPWTEPMTQHLVA
jgi:hypothetical protein